MIMGMDEIVQEGIKVDFDKPRTLLYTNRGFRSLCSTYENVANAIDALEKITPRKIHKKDDAIEGSEEKYLNDVYSDIPQDEKLYATMKEWLYAGFIHEDRALTKDAVLDAIDEMSILDLISMRVSIWEALTISLTKKKKGAEDPTTTTE
jgi:hypothetical protein